jgi:hypothetical protein
MGLLLKSAIGKQTRLGSRLFPSWVQFAEHAWLEETSTIRGEKVHRIEHLKTEGDWRIRHRNCDPEACVEVWFSEGISTCKSCFGLGSERNFSWRVSDYVLDMHKAQLLFALMYKGEDAGVTLIEELRNGANYHPRRYAYDKVFQLPKSDLHAEVKKSFVAKMRLRMTAAFSYFCSQTVVPCLQVEPHHTLRAVQSQRLCDFLLNDPDVTPSEYTAVFSIASLSIRRHPGLHGAAVAMAEKFKLLEAGKSTMRSRGRKLVFPQAFF